MNTYRRIEYKAGKTIEVIETYSGQAGRRMTREKYTGRTPEAMRRYNEKLQHRRLTRLINANFAPQDFFVTLHYTREQRPEPKKAAAQLSAFLRSLKRLYKKHGGVLKYIKVTAYGDRGGIHHHIVINNIGVDIRQITALWRYSVRTPDYTPLYNTGEYSGLAAYLLRQTRNGTGDTEEISGRRYSGSRNLKQPEIICDKYINAIKWREPPTAKKGYIIDTDTIDAGINEQNGKPYLFYRQIKAEPDLSVVTTDGRRLYGHAAQVYIWEENRRLIKEKWAELSPYGKVVQKNN